MSSAENVPRAGCHIVALPYPGWGHVNPMMNLCKLLLARCKFLTITYVVTEEWLELISSRNKPENINFATIPNVLPSEKVRAENMESFIEAIMTKMEEPFEQLLDCLEGPLTVILADVCVAWGVDVGKRRNIPVALLWPMPVSVFSLFYYFDLLVENGVYETSDTREELVDYIPGLSPIKISDLPPVLRTKNQLQRNQLALMSKVPKAQCLLFSSIFELEASVFEALKSKFLISLFSLGPLVPYFDIPKTSLNNHPEYIKWLDSQTQRSVLYVSLGSFLSVTDTQMDEILFGLSDSNVKFLLVARDNALPLDKKVSRDIGMVVPWCDQLRVLCHPSTGGFWTHCGWNSTMESILAGVPMIGFPIAMDQPTVSKIIAEDWKIGWKLKGAEWGSQSLVTRDEVSELVTRFMDPENEERKEMTERALKIQEICLGAIQEGGSSNYNLDSFIQCFVSSEHCSIPDKK